MFTMFSFKICVNDLACYRIDILRNLLLPHTSGKSQRTV